MKILARPVDAIAVFKESKYPMPYRFRFAETDGSVEDVIVDRIYSIDERKIAGTRAYVYRCQSIIGGVERIYELKYLIEEAKWQLYKI